MALLIESEAPRVLAAMETRHRRAVYGREGFRERVQRNLTFQVQDQLSRRRVALIVMEQCRGWPPKTAE